MPDTLASPVVLVGAFERHNFGDLLLGRIMARCLAEHGLQPLYASILPADLRALGGEWVNSFADLAPFLPPDVPIVHVGGETIPCSMGMALRMDAPPVLADSLANRLAKSCRPSGLDDREFAYLTPPVETICGKTYRWHNRYFFGLGGASIAGQPPQAMAGLRDVLQDARWLSVRDTTTLRGLHACGVAHARPSWDAGVLAPCLAAGGSATLAAPVAAEPGGSLLFHANKAFLAPRLDLLAAQIAAAAGRFSRVRVSLAAAAANHDSAAASEQLAARLAATGIPAEFCPDVHVDTIATLIRDAACVVSTSLHYRIVALTHGVPRVSLENGKVAGWASDWDPGYPYACPAEGMAANIARAVAVPREEAVQAAGKARGEALASIVDLVAEIHRHTPELSLSLPGAEGSGAGQVPLGPGWSIRPDQWIAEMGRWVRQAREDASRARQDLAEAKGKLQAARNELAGIRKSPWWKLGSPLRKFRHRSGK